MARGLHPLTYLCQFFDTVEVNSSFYRPPAAKHSASWLDKVEGNARFTFTVKLWQRFTHERETPPTPGDVRVFLAGIAPLVDAGKMRAILIQFPWSFKRTRENRLWLARVTDALTDYPLALEVRHASWDVPDVRAALAERAIAFCNIDHPEFSGSIKATAHVTARLGYVRLHGRNHENWFREDAGRDDRYNYLYTQGELAPWIEKIEGMRSEVDELYVITNNHYRGQAVVNAFELRDRLGGEGAPPPQCLVDTYPHLKTRGCSTLSR